MRLPASLLALPVLACALFLAAGCTANDDDALPTLQRDIPFRPDGTLSFVQPDGSTAATIAIEIAEGDSAQARGLMQRRALGYNQGMLFPYPNAAERTFWMRNTPLALDILFADADGQIIRIAERTEPFSDTRIRSGAPAQYVVEVRAGFAERFELREDSTRIRWQRD